LGVLYPNRCTDGVKFGTEEGTKFHSRRCNGYGIGPPKLKILLKIGVYIPHFDKGWLKKATLQFLSCEC